MILLAYHGHWLGLVYPVIPCFDTLPWHISLVWSRYGYSGPAMSHQNTTRNHCVIKLAWYAAEGYRKRYTNLDRVITVGLVLHQHIIPGVCKPISIVQLTKQVTKVWLVLLKSTLRQVYVWSANCSLKKTIYSHRPSIPDGLFTRKKEPEIHWPQ